MAAALLPDPLWDLVEPLLPIRPRLSQGGRPRASDRACLTGIVFVLRSGIPWQMLPQELGCGSGMTCWRRLRDWQHGERVGSDPLCALGLAGARRKRHLICDGRGVPLAVRLTGANRNDSQEALALVDAISPLHGERGRLRQRPDCGTG
jgi:transposase